MMSTFYYYIDSVLHRDEDKPAIIRKNGTRYWYQYGKIHRENGPAVIRKRPNYSQFEWWNRGVLERANDLPAITRYYYDGTIKVEAYFENGQLHRKYPNPAVVCYNQDGTPRTFSFFSRGRQLQPTFKYMYYQLKSGKIARVEVLNEYAWDYPLV